MDDAKADEMGYRRRRERKGTRGFGGYGTGGNATANIVPDWYREQKRKEKMMMDQGEKEDTSVMMTSIEKRIAAYRNV